jgi:hypothetical protein
MVVESESTSASAYSSLYIFISWQPNHLTIGMVTYRKQYILLKLYRYSESKGQRMARYGLRADILDRCLQYVSRTCMSDDAKRTAQF